MRGHSLLPLGRRLASIAFGQQLPARPHLREHGEQHPRRHLEGRAERCGGGEQAAAVESSESGTTLGGTQSDHFKFLLHVTTCNM